MIKSTIAGLSALTLAAALAVSSTVAAAADPAMPKKVLRYAFEIAESGLDPVRYNDIYSRALGAHVFESLYAYDHLARPVKIKPLTADGMPVVTDEFRTWTIKVKPGTYFQSDPAFKGVKRELVAQDYVYAIKRFADPANLSPLWSDLDELEIVGLNALNKEAVEKKKPFDYDRPIDGLRALDRYTLQIRLRDPRPTFLELLALTGTFGAVAREVVETYGDRFDAHPAGTGPFKLVQWRRSSFLAFERNTEYRERYYDAEPAADDAEGQALLARFKGRRLPMIDRVEISIIEEVQPRWLSFVNGEANFLDKLPIQFVNVGIPGGKLAPNLARRGIRAHFMKEPGTTYIYFNMDDPTVGGLTPEKVALRRAVSLGMDVGAEIRNVRNGRAVPANSLFLPFASGYHESQKTEYSDYDPARAQALLDLYGYLDRDGDGWRDMPDGSPLVLRLATQPDSQTRSLSDLFRKNMDALHLRTEFPVAKWPENMKSARSGKLMMWSLGGSAVRADGQDSLTSYGTRQIQGGGNFARFSLPAMDAIIDRTQVMPDGPEREALFAQADRLAVAYMPYKYRVIRLLTDMTYPALVGYRRPVFWRDWWQYVDIDETQRPKQ